jgi:hypothetical protein
LRAEVIRMPVQKVANGYRWGPTGTVVSTRKQAEMQGAATESSRASYAMRWPAKKGKERKRV